jgi:Ca2+/Na+ antiporter
MGLFFICSHVISSHALHIRNHSDLAIAVETRALLCIFILFAQVWSQIAYTKDWSGKHWVGISLFSTWTGIAVIYRLYLWVSLKRKDFQTELVQNKEYCVKRKVK